MTDTRAARPGLLAAVARGPVVLDAAHGTRLIARGLDLSRDDPSLWCLDRPGEVADLHARDVAAGADAVLTNTFGANRTWLGRLGRGDDAPAVNRRAVALAREAAGPARHVLGSVGPTALRDADAFAEQIDALVSAGVDGLLFETCGPAEGEPALRRARDAVGPSVPRVVSFFEPPDPDSLRRLEELGAAAVGMNCVGWERGVTAVRELARVTRLPWLFKPSHPFNFESPEGLSSVVRELFTLGVRLMGGCCGTDERFVAAVRAACYDAPGERVTGR